MADDDDKRRRRRRRREPDRHDVDEIVRLRLRRQSLAAIAEHLDLPPKTVRRILTDEGYPGPLPQFDPVLRAQIAEAWLGGETQRSIASRLGLSQPAVHYHIRRYMDLHRDPAHLRPYREYNGWGGRNEI